MNQRTTLYMIRHGETDWNVERRFQGHMDIALNARGRQQAIALGQRLQAHPIELFLSSDLSRAYETASLIVAQREVMVPIQRTALLREMDMGQAAGLLRDEITARFGPELVIQWREAATEHNEHFRFPGGESKAQVVERAVGAVRQLVEGARPAVAAVTTHGGVLKHLLHALFPEVETGHIPNCSTFEISFDHEAARWSYHGQLELE